MRASHPRVERLAPLVIAALVAIVVCNAFAVINHHSKLISSHVRIVVDQAPISRSLAKVLPTEPAPLRHTPAPTKPNPKPKQKPKLEADPWVAYGYDISWPQCYPFGGSILPQPRGTIAIVGITGGRPHTANPCLDSQWAWAKTRANPSAYINLAFPHELIAPDSYGVSTVRLAIARAHSAGMKLTGVWLDVEVGNHWSRNRRFNNILIQSAIQELGRRGVQAGIYTTPLNWVHITGNARIDVPLWLAIADPNAMFEGCRRTGVGARTPDMVQASLVDNGHQFDWNMICRKRADFARFLDASS